MRSLHESKFFSFVIKGNFLVEKWELVVLTCPTVFYESLKPIYPYSGTLFQCKKIFVLFHR